MSHSKTNIQEIILKEQEDLKALVQDKTITQRGAAGKIINILLNPLRTKEQRKTLFEIYRTNIMAFYKPKMEKLIRQVFPKFARKNISCPDEDMMAYINSFVGCQGVFLWITDFDEEYETFLENKYKFLKFFLALPFELDASDKLNQNENVTKYRSVFQSDFTDKRSKKLLEKVIALKKNTAIYQLVGVHLDELHEAIIAFRSEEPIDFEHRAADKQQANLYMQLLNLLVKKVPYILKAIYQLRHASHKSLPPSVCAIIDSYIPEDVQQPGESQSFKSLYSMYGFLSAFNASEEIQDKITCQEVGVKTCQS